MWFFAGNKNSKSLLETGGRNFEFTGNAADSFLSALSVNHSLNADQISVFTLSDQDPWTLRVRNGDSYSLVWSNDGEITGLDFSLEDNKRIITLSSADSSGNPTTSFVADGEDFLNVTVTAMLPDLSAIDTTYNSSVMLPVINPDNKMAYVKMQIINGVAVKQFKTTEYGIWRIPSRADILGSNARVKNAVYQLNALMAV